MKSSRPQTRSLLIWCRLWNVPLPIVAMRLLALRPSHDDLLSQDVDAGTPLKSLRTCPNLNADSSLEPAHAHARVLEPCRKDLLRARVHQSSTRATVPGRGSDLSVRADLSNTLANSGSHYTPTSRHSHLPQQVSSCSNFCCSMLYTRPLLW